MFTSIDLREAATDLARSAPRKGYLPPLMPPRMRDGVPVDLVVSPSLRVAGDVVMLSHLETISPKNFVHASMGTPSTSVIVITPDCW